MPTSTGTKACRNLLLYALSKLDEAEQESFELHLMECDECFDDLKALERTGDVLHRMVAQHPPELAQALTILKRRRLRVTLTGGTILAAALTAAFLLGRYLFPA